MKTAPVNVVIPAYNSGATVRDAIDSILAQTLVPSRIIVIDDGSGDDTADRLRCYGDRVLYRRQANAGPSAARNHGVRLCTEPLVAFLDADDVWHPRKLELQMRHMERDPELGLLATDYFDWPVARFADVPSDASGSLTPVTWEQLVIKATILTSSVVVRRDVLERVGQFDQTLCGPEDRDMFLRIAEVTRLAKLNTPLIGYRDSPGSLTKRAETCERGMRRILRSLDERRAWRGRWLLRRKAISFMHHSCAAAQARAGNHAGAVLREIKSLAVYPLPYGADQVRIPCERLKRLVVNVLRILHLKRPDREAFDMPLPIIDAVQALRQTAPASPASPALSASPQVTAIS
jgi:glycosyltransferase involved in cell wall biosynthesis